jgi:hypothetical protein
MKSVQNPAFPAKNKKTPPADFGSLCPGSNPALVVSEALKINDLLIRTWSRASRYFNLPDNGPTIPT